MFFAEKIQAALRLSRTTIPAREHAAAVPFVLLKLIFEIKRPPGQRLGRTTVPALIGLIAAEVHYVTLSRPVVRMVRTMLPYDSHCTDLKVGCDAYLGLVPMFQAPPGDTNSNDRAVLCTVFLQNQDEE